MLKEDIGKRIRDLRVTKTNLRRRNNSVDEAI